MWEFVNGRAKWKHCWGEDQYWIGKQTSQWLLGITNSFPVLLVCTVKQLNKHNRDLCSGADREWPQRKRVEINILEWFNIESLFDWQQRNANRMVRIVYRQPLTTAGQQFREGPRSSVDESQQWLFCYKHIILLPPDDQQCNISQMRTNESEKACKRWGEE